MDLLRLLEFINIVFLCNIYDLFSCVLGDVFRTVPYDDTSAAGRPAASAAHHTIQRVLCNSHGRRYGLPFW